MKDVPVPQSSLWTHAGLTPVSPFLSCVGEPRAGHSTPDVVSAVLSRGGGSPLSHLLAVLFLMQPRRLLATFVIRVHCWLVNSCLSIRTPKSFRAVLQPVSPQHVLVPGVIPPLVQDLAFPSVKLQNVAINPISSLSRLL